MYCCICNIFKMTFFHFFFFYNLQWVIQRKSCCFYIYFFVKIFCTNFANLAELTFRCVLSYIWHTKLPQYMPGKLRPWAQYISHNIQILLYRNLLCTSYFSLNLKKKFLHFLNLFVNFAA